jgi:acetate kinase
MSSRSNSSSTAASRSRSGTDWCTAGRGTPPRVVLDDGVIRYLDSITDLAPLHHSRAVAGIREVFRLLDMPAVAAFDTAFPCTLSAAARTYVFHREWNHRWDLRRFGFHDLSQAPGGTPGR